MNERSMSWQLHEEGEGWGGDIGVGVGRVGEGRGVEGVGGSFMDNAVMIRELSSLYPASAPHVHPTTRNLIRRLTWGLVML